VLAYLAAAGRAPDGAVPRTLADSGV